MHGDARWQTPPSVPVKAHACIPIRRPSRPFYSTPRPASYNQSGQTVTVAATGVDAGVAINNGVNSILWSDGVNVKKPG